MMIVLMRTMATIIGLLLTNTTIDHWNYDHFAATTTTAVLPLSLPLLLLPLFVVAC